MLKRLLIGIALVAPAVNSIAAEKADSFDLICKGEQRALSILGEKVEEYTYRYRVDLKAGLWCEGECKYRHPLANVSPTQITLTDKKADTPSERTIDSNFVNRETGAHYVLSSSSNPRDRRATISITWKGQCDPAAFSGFPDFATRF